MTVLGEVYDRKLYTHLIGKMMMMMVIGGETEIEIARIFLL